LHFFASKLVYWLSTVWPTAGADTSASAISAPPMRTMQNSFAAIWAACVGRRTAWRGSVLFLAV
jgi:hypothetical protein